MIEIKKYCLIIIAAYLVFGITGELCAESVYGIFSTETDTLENFDDGDVQLQSYSNQDLEPSAWTLSSSNTANNSPYSLKLFGNTWKLEPVEPRTLNPGDVWQVSAYIQNTAEFQGFGLTDSVNTLLYSFAGTQILNTEEWITVYQGAFPNHNWNIYQLPVMDDWMARFGYQPVIKGIVFINNRDYSNYGTIYFDEIIDITNDLPIVPQVDISYSIGKVYLDVNGLRSVDVDFTSEVYDPDSDYHTFFWNFGDGSASTEENPSHTFLVEDDHNYTVLLKVIDDTDLLGTASVQITVDPGPTSFPVTMNFVGDIILARRIEDLINLYGVESIFDPTIEFLGSAADVTVVNLESPLTNMGTPHPTKSIVFRGSPQNVEGLTYAGIDVATLANNHIIDYGLVGLQQTQNVLDQNNIIHFGAGADSYEALKPAFYSVNGVNFAFLGASDRTGQYNNWQPYLNAGFNKPGFANLTRSNITSQINAVKDISDLVVLQWHSGSEYSISPSERFENTFMDEEDENYSAYRLSPTESDIELRHYAVDQGADVVICHHPHILQGFEVYNGKLIAHSLGNFIFDLNYPETFPSVILNSKINGAGFYEYSILPVYIDDYIPVIAHGELGLHILDDLANRSKQLNTYLNIDREEIIAEIILDTTTITGYSIPSVVDVQLEQKDGHWVSAPVRLNKNGSLSELNSITPANSWEFRLGKELVWFGNAEDEGCSLWELNHPDEYFDTTNFYRGERSLCQKRPPGLLPLNTNLEKRIKLYPGSSLYTLHSQIKTENAADAGVLIQFFNTRYETNPVATADLGLVVNGTTSWQFYENEISVPGNANYFNLRLRSISPSIGDGYSWFDDTGVIKWTEWMDYSLNPVINNPNDYYWIQIRAGNEVHNSTLRYSEIIYKEKVTESGSRGKNIPENYILYQNFPNPFNPVTTIRYELPVNSKVQMIIYDILGNEIRTLVNENQSAGTKNILWNGLNNYGVKVSSGVYFYHIRANDFIKTKKLILLK